MPSGPQILSIVSVHQPLHIWKIKLNAKVRTSNSFKRIFSNGCLCAQTRTWYFASSSYFCRFNLSYAWTFPLRCQNSERFVFLCLAILNLFFQHELSVLFTANIKPIFTRSLKVIICKVADESVIGVNQLSHSVPFPVYPWSRVFGPSCRVRVNTLSMTLVFVPVSIVHVPVWVGVNAVAISTILNPATLVTWAIWIPKRALTVFLAFNVFPDVLGTVFEAVCTVSVSFAVRVVSFISVTVWKSCFTESVSLLVFVSFAFVLLQENVT